MKTRIHNGGSAQPLPFCISHVLALILYRTDIWGFGKGKIVITH